MKKPTEDHSATVERQEHILEVLIGYVLLGGVMLSVILVILGLIWQWFHTGTVGVHYTLAPKNLFAFVVSEFRQVAADKIGPQLLVSLGMTVLLLTPYVRILTSLIFFAFVEHNRKYTVFTGFVLAVLTYSLFLR